MARQIFPGGRGASSAPKVSVSKHGLLNFNAAAALEFKIKLEDQFAVFFDDTKETIELERPGKGEQVASGGITARQRKGSTGPVYFSLSGALSHFGIEVEDTVNLPCVQQQEGKVLALDVSVLMAQAAKPSKG